MNRIVVLEFAGFVFDTGVILENELEVGRRTYLDKYDKYLYETVSSLLRIMVGPIYLSSEYICA